MTPDEEFIADLERVNAALLEALEDAVLSMERASLVIGLSHPGLAVQLGFSAMKARAAIAQASTPDPSER
jgi:hypothetical protein